MLWLNRHLLRQDQLQSTTTFQRQDQRGQYERLLFGLLPIYFRSVFKSQSQMSAYLQIRTEAIL